MINYSQHSEPVDVPTPLDNVMRELKKRPLNSRQIEKILRESNISPKEESSIFCKLNKLFIGYHGNYPVYSADRSWKGYKFTLF